MLVSLIGYVKKLQGNVEEFTTYFSIVWDIYHKKNQLSNLYHYDSERFYFVYTFCTCISCLQSHLCTNTFYAQFHPVGRIYLVHKFVLCTSSYSTQDDPFVQVNRI